MSRTSTPVQFRLTDDDRAKIDAIRERYGLPSAAAAVRYAVETVHRQIEPAPRPRKKSGKNSREGA